jgi:hypothetical protein
MYIQWFWLTNGGNQKKTFPINDGNQKHFGNDKKFWQSLGLVNFAQFGNQIFWIAWFGDRIILGNN